MSVEYSAVAAKLRSMYSRILTDKDYDELLSKNSVNDVCAYLKGTAGYGETLRDVNERDIHRGQMELLLENELVEEYIRVYRFVDHDKRKMLEFWFMRYETGFLKREIRYIYTHEERSNDEINEEKFNTFFKTHTKINQDIMRNAKSISDCIEACKDTPYADLLRRAEDMDFFSIGMILDSYCYTSMWRALNKMLSKEQAELFKKLTGTQIDMLNLIWIYRGKKYFEFSPEIIFTYLLPVRYRISEDALKQLVTAEDIEKFVELVGMLTPYAPLFENEVRFPEENYRCFYNRLSKNIFVNHSQSMAAIYAYLSLKEAEFNNITAVIEGIRYGLNTDYIRKHIGA